MTSEVTGDSLSTQKEIGADQKKFLTEVLTYYREFAGEKADDEQTRARTANAAFRVGEIEYRLGRKEQGNPRRFKWPGTATGHWPPTSPPCPTIGRNWPVSHNNLGNLLADLGKQAEAEEQYRQALAIVEKLAADFPAVPAYRQYPALATRTWGFCWPIWGNAGGGGAVPPGAGHPGEAGRRLPHRARPIGRSWPPATTTWGCC